MSEPNAEQAKASAGIADTIRKDQAESASASDAANPTQASEQVTSQPSSDSGGLQSTEKLLYGDEAKSESVTEQPATTVEGSESKQDDDRAQGVEETKAGAQQAGDTTKEGEPAQVGEKRTHPEETVNEKGEADEGEGTEGTGAKKLKTDESKPAEEEAEATKGKRGTRKSTRKATTAKTATTEGKKRSVGRPRKNAPAEKHVEEKETMDVAPQPVAEHIN